MYNVVSYLMNSPCALETPACACYKMSMVVLNFKDLDMASRKHLPSSKAISHFLKVKHKVSMSKLILYCFFFFLLNKVFIYEE